MKKLIAGLIALTLVFTCLAGFNTQESIIVCSCLEQFRNEELQLQLNQKFPHKNIIVMYMPTGKAATKVFVEGDRTEIDILVAMETSYMNKLKGSLADIDGYSAIDYVDELKPSVNDNLWVTWDRQAGAIVVNKDVLQKHNLDAPKTYSDLLKPEYKNLIAMPDPKSSGTGYFFYKNWVNTMGDEKALEYIDALYPNIKQFTESGSGPIKLLKQGEIAIGLALSFQAVNEINNGMPFEIIFPQEGSPYSLTGTGIIKGHDKKDDIEEIYEFIVNDFLIYDKENYSPEKVYEGQINKIENYPQNIKYADMTGIQDINEKERLLKLWKY